ncbi:MAG TPA: FtsH protease activity modulator HflK [Phycisphaerae bacterium]|nr:FtsH protease activity modulator HflK [Phycisphaerae bacterium]
MTGPHGHGPSHARGHDHPHRPLSWRKALLALLAAGLLAYLATGVYVVRTNEHAVVRRFGRALRHVRTPDLYFDLPYGLDRVTRVKVREAKRVGVGMGLADQAMGRSGQPEQNECLTGDTNLILVSAVVQYHVAADRARDYCFHVADVPGLVRSVAAAELTRLISGMAVDDVLTVERVAIQTRVRQAVQRTLDRYGAGVLVTSVLLPSKGVAPPEQVADAFRDVTSAGEDKRRAINVAEGYAMRTEPQSRGEAHRVLTDAAAYANELVEMARGDAERFTSEAAELKTNRRLTLRRLVLETMEQVLPRVRKVVLDANASAVDLGIIEGDK